MKFLVLACITTLFSVSLFAQLNVIQYKLDNGLTVILNPDKNQSTISGAVAVNTGSKNDPSDATGISHYLEHLLFKGTTELGTTNYKAKKVHLDSIYYLYDELAKTKEEEKRDEIQQRINYHSVEASQYAMPNEFDKLLKSIGSTGINATTNNDLTIYYNTFPSHQAQKWLNIYAHRFLDPVFRSFQSELEVVYEEKNRAMDNLQIRILEAYNREFYRNHPYGEKTTLGTTEHLKNPSLKKMYDYYKTYYVANNMALIVSGNFEIGTIKPFIKENFGKLKTGIIPKNKIAPPTAFLGKKLVKKRITPIKVGIYGFRTVPQFHVDEAPLVVADYLLQNDANTGFIDELTVNNKIMMAFSFSDQMDEAGNQTFIIIPKVFIQSFNKVEKLLFSQLDKLKNGSFSDQLLTSVKNEIYKNNQLEIEDIQNRVYLMASAFRAGLTWKELKKKLESVKKVTKEDIQRVAKQYFGENYLAIHSRTGFPKKEKLDKPAFQTLKINQDKNSTYAEAFNLIQELEPQERFIDFEEDLEIIQLGEKSNLYVVENRTNDIYELEIKFHQGQLSEPKLEALKEFMDLSYPTGRKLRAFKENIGVLGSSLSFSSSSNSFSISLKGIEKNLPQLLQQIDSLIKSPVVNEKNLKTIANIFKTDRKQEEDDAVLIAQAIAQYGLYGENSLLSNRLTVKEISNITVSEYLTLWKEVKSRAVSIHFSGKTNASDLKKLLAQNLTLNYNGTSEVPYPVNLVKRDRNEVVLIDNNKIRQSHLFFIKNTGMYTKADDSRTALFKQYFDGGFSGILTQEVREYRSLAYSSSANINYTLAKKPESYFYTYIGTQADKTNESVKLTYDLIQNMPEKPERLTDIKKNVTLKQQADFPDFRELSSVVESYLMVGYKQDPNELSAPEYKEISFNNLVSFYESKIQAQATFLGIHGDSKQFDIKELEKIGKIIKLKKEDVIRF